MKNNKGAKPFLNLNPASFGGRVCFFDKSLNRLSLFNGVKRFFCFIPFSFFNCRELAYSRLEFTKSGKASFVETRHATSLQR